MAFEAHPLREGLTLWNALRCAYLAIFGLYWLYNLAHLFVDLREAAVIAHFTQHRLGLSPRQLSTVTWPEVARRIVDVRGPPRCGACGCAGAGLMKEFGSSTVVLLTCC